MEIAGTLLLCLWYAVLAVLAFFALHRLGLAGRDRRLAAAPAVAEDPDFRPFVTVQLPIYNERYVVARLLDAVAGLDWPRERFEIQILDDSTDETTAVAGGIAERLLARGFAVDHVRRANRDGFKAGALAEGLRRARGEFLLLLDADFLAPPDLLLRLMPAFRDPDVGMVQARWGHINRDANGLTSTQALFLDAHFLLETGVRARAGVFFNFHGTAGVWRRAAILDAGGWSADTLTEDLDLSYRAQMAGWRFVFRPDVVVPAELPETLAAFKRQQARWTQGAAATSRKILPRLRRGVWPRATRFEAFMHLGAHIVHPLTLLVAVLAGPVVLLRASTGLAGALWPLDLLLAAAIIVPTRLFYGAAARRAGIASPDVLNTLRLLFAATALAVSNTRAAIAGWRGTAATFERTPKTVGVPRTAEGYRPAKSPGLAWVEGGVALWLSGGLLLTPLHGGLGAAPFLALLAFAYARSATTA